MLAEDIPDCDFFFSQIWLSGFVNEFRNPTGRAYKKILCIYRGYHLWFYFGKQDAYEVGEYLVDKFVRNSKFVKQLNQEIVKWADRLRAYAVKLPADNLADFSNNQLWQIYKKHDQEHTKYYSWCWIPVAADMFHVNLTERLKAHLCTIGVSENRLNEYFVILTQPGRKSLIQIEHDELLKIAMIAKKSPKRVTALLKRHYEKYFYVNHMWVGQVFTFNHYVRDLNKLIRSKTNPKAVLAQEERKFKNGLQKRAKLIKQLRITGKWKILFDAFGDFMVTKIYRRYAQIYALYRMEPVLKEIGKRVGLNLKQVRFMLPEEVRTALRGKVKKQEIKKRTKFCVYYAEKGRDTVFTGQKAQALAKKAQKVSFGKVTELKGQTGCIGRAKGVVKIIIRPKDMTKMKKGDILVSIATDPDIVPAMKKAGAIVTEQGGVTSHAAIVSRELNIPCVIGTKIATRVLKDGDKVEVDANKGVVKKL